MSTKKLAKELGFLRQRSQSSDGAKTPLLSKQIFSYLIVIDFESTCWRDRNNHSPEIIEFPAVVMNTSTGEVESEFHTYVQPQEHPVLSEFCTELTGITQIQVEAGIPLQIVLSRFGRWLQNLQLEMGLVFPNRPQGSSAPSPSQKQCAFVTWSDWDLGVCLQYECKRKQLHKPDVLNSWIDLRSTYRLFYDRKPKGLNGALQDLGIQFSGREHSGIKQRKTCFVFSLLPQVWMTPGIQLSCLISPKTLLNGTTTPLWGCGSRRSVKAVDVANNFSSVMMNRLSMHNNSSNNNNNNNNGSSFVLCSTTVGHLSSLPPTNQPCDAGATVEEDGAELLVETEDRCGSYDDVVLEEKTSTPHTSFARPKAVVPKSSFAIFADPAKPSRPSSRGSLCASKNVLSSLSTNVLDSHANRASVGGQRTTSPLCGCGRRAKRQAVSNGGPNQGRGFYCCPVRRSGGGGRIQKGCEFFKWESALLRSGSGGVPAVGSSVSLCQINLTLTRPPQRATLRKSY
uniref:GRF-type domain-containing protein n=1 Tax=Cyclopterus lumpus TaxID=8103 RepID=A0A8C2W6U1_CYCLU